MDPQFDPSKACSILEPLLRMIIANSALNLTFRVSRQSSERPAITIIFEGPDVQFLLARNAELLLALEHIAAKSLRLEPEEHDQISFDAGGFKAQRAYHLHQAVERAVEEVRRTGRAFHFPPTNSRERRLQHLALAKSGMETVSEGEGPLRHLVLHPGRR